MSPFTFARAENPDAAILEKSGSPSAAFIAGGTNLLDLMKENVARPSKLVDIGRLQYAEIAEHGGGVRLGALATNAETASHPLVRDRYPLLSEAILAGASPQLRNMATNGGNLLQRTRCYYFYDTATPCNKRVPGSGCPALEGYNRIHAILGASEHCIAVHPSDFCVGLAALEAEVVVKGPAGERSIPFHDFHRLPGDHPEVDNRLAADEMIVAIDLPEKGFGSHYHYLKVRDRQSYAFALVSVALGVEVRDGVIEETRIALGGVAHKPWRLIEAEQLLIGRPAKAASFREAADAILSAAEGYRFNSFKIELARRSILRAAALALQNQ